MLLDLQDDELVLSISSSLATYQKRQFSYYGARQDTEGSFHFKDASAELVNRLIAFCEAEELKIDLTPPVQGLVVKHQSEQSYHQQFISNAGNFKNGKYSKEDYAAHVNFLNKHIQRKLLDHQVKASYHLSLVGNGANFSVPGSGKTTVLLSYYEKLKTMHKVDVLFVVGPPACFGPWRDEFKVVLGRNPNECLLAGGSQTDRKRLYSYPPEGAELFLTTFQTLQNDFGLVKSMLAKDNLRALLVIDEAHYIKQVDGRWANAVLAIAPAAKYRCVLTGTPAPHSYKDLFNLFAFLWQEHSPISDEDHARLEIYEKNHDYERAGKLLAPKLDPLFYRVRKKDLGLMPQHMNVVPLKMRPAEKAIYDVVIGNVRRLTTRDYLKQM
ncbi:MAG: helicase, superfamily, partial [Candidatus Saccharibacteria bacterium]|nr:helicase, superfamily [Candidatus Saccharibacteria bacterium]